LQVPNIDSLPGFKKHLGKARAARIRYAQKGTFRRQPCAKNIENTVIEQMQYLESIDGHPIEDILCGFARANHDSKPIGVSSLVTILQCMPIINTREIQLMFDISDRQARKYLQVISASLPFIETAMTAQKTERFG
jgi:hypothetical protein